MALLGAMATLLAALVICLAPGAGHHGGTESGDGARMTRVAGTAAGDSWYACPYDDGGCGLTASLSPAVLTAPPLDPPPHQDGPALLVPPAGGGRVDGTFAARPRAPDLHLLQVLRT